MGNNTYERERGKGGGEELKVQKCRKTHMSGWYVDRAQVVCGVLCLKMICVRVEVVRSHILRGGSCFLPFTQISQTNIQQM